MPILSSGIQFFALDRTKGFSLQVFCRREFFLLFWSLQGTSEQSRAASSSRVHKLRDFRFIFVESTEISLSLGKEIVANGKARHLSSTFFALSLRFLSSLPEHRTTTPKCLLCPIEPFERMSVWEEKESTVVKKRVWSFPLSLSRDISAERYRKRH